MNDSKQSKGGKVRASKLSTEQRRQIAKAAAKARWDRLKDPHRIPEADSQGLLRIGDVDLEVFVLDDKRRVINKRGMANALRLQSEGGNAFLRSMSRKGVRSALTEDVIFQIENPIVFKPLIGDSSDGYLAETLIEVCDALVEAKNQDLLHPSQHFLARQAEIIIRSAAKVGIIALVDEAAGYVDKAKDEYRKLFDKFVRNEFRQWDQEFPDKFFDMIYKMYGLKRQKPDSTRHPQFFGHFIRKYIYHPLANSNGAILEKLEEKNPVVYDNGGRRYKFFQWLTDEVGVMAFRQHLWQVVGIGESSADKIQFDRGFYRAFPEAIPKGQGYQMDFWDVLDGDKK